MDMTAEGMAIAAASMIKRAQEDTSMSLLELAAAFRVAAATCEQTNQMNENAVMQAKIRGWRPGS